MIRKLKIKAKKSNRYIRKFAYYYGSDMYIYSYMKKTKRGKR